jgi:uncharacterized hydrophobic protein (TIGR00271 family)
VGLYTSTFYIIIAAMLVAPFAGPAMNVALATARGDQKLLKQSLFRYFVALLLTIGVVASLAWLFQLQTPTAMMIEIGTISAVAVILPLVAGAAGALNLVQDEGTSLVSGTAVGILVAASLAPPAGLIGAASILGRWDLVQSGSFTLLLQLVGINLAGTMVFRLYRLDAQGSRYQRGRPIIFYSSLAITLICLSGLLVWQFSRTPDLQRTSIAQQALSEVQKVVEESNLAHFLRADLTFTRSARAQDTLLGVVYVQRLPEVSAPEEQIKQALTQAIQRHLATKHPSVTPLAEVIVLETLSEDR